MSSCRFSFRRTAAATAATAALALTGSLLAAAPAEARPWPGHPDRNLVTHVVQPGDTATGLSMRYHAWTREFIRLNGSRLMVGERVKIPVVVSAARKARAQQRGDQARTQPKAEKTKRKATKKAHQVGHRGWRHTRMSRSQVRDLIRVHAKRRDVPVRLAQAVAWQESGWRQRLVSIDGAIGVMQVLPSTGRWMSDLAGHSIRLRDTHGNVRAGTMLLRVLLDHTRTQRSAVAAYYEGLRGIQDGWYDDTKRYVRNVMAIKRQLERTGHPTG